MSAITANIEYSSRYDRPDEIAEMENFIRELTDLEATHLVTRVFYDSKCDTCFIETTSSDYSAKVKYCADIHLSQFEVYGSIGHGNGNDMYDDDDVDVEAIDIDIDIIDEDPIDDVAGPDVPAPEAVDQDARRRRLERGREGEEALSDWFSSNGLAYISICQNPEVFSRVFQGSIKRPDFLLLFDSLGLIAIDAKNVSPYHDRYSLPLEEELHRAITFERVFRIPLWYAIKGPDRWYWISALKAIEVGRHHVNRKTSKRFISIHVSEFIDIQDGDDMSKLYGQRMPSYRNIYPRGS